MHSGSSMVYIIFPSAPSILQTSMDIPNTVSGIWSGTKFQGSPWVAKKPLHTKAG